MAASSEAEEPRDLEDIIDEIGQTAAEHEGKTSVQDLLEAFGRRSFGPLLLLPSLIAFTPLGGIPVLPSVMACGVVLVAGQLLVGRRHFWLPKVLRRRRVDSQRLEASLKYLRRPAHWVDAVIRPRLGALTREPFGRIVAACCILLALTVPPLEFIPFAGAAAWAAIGAFGLSLIARDGLLVLVALALSLSAGYMLYTVLL